MTKPPQFAALTDEQLAALNKGDSRNPYAVHYLRVLTQSRSPAVLEKALFIAVRNKHYSFAEAIVATSAEIQHTQKEHEAIYRRGVEAFMGMARPPLRLAA
jgi:hypothetical protein